MTAVIIAVSVGGAVLIIATLALGLIGIIKAFKSGWFSKKEKIAQAEETRMIQDIYHGLTEMEERVEALETILIERQRKDFQQ